MSGVPQRKPTLNVFKRARPDSSDAEEMDARSNTAGINPKLLTLSYRQQLYLIPRPKTYKVCFYPINLSLTTTLIQLLSA